ncbi:MAG: DUF6263 family protein [Planctomycetota bacterium]
MARGSVQEQLAGKRITCPKCNSTSVVPSESPRIKFTCRNCGQGIRVLQIHAGKEGKCPKCQSPIVVPSLRADPADGSETVIFVCSMCNETIRAPKGSKERFTECPQCGSNVETSLRGEPVESDPSIPQGADEDEYDDESDLVEEYEGLDRRVILIISAAALALVAGLIILITVVLPPGSGPNEDLVAPARQETVDPNSQSQPAAPDARPIGTFTLEPPKENIAPKEPVDSPIVTSAAVPGSDLILRLKPGQKRSVRLIKKDRISPTVTGQGPDIISTGTTELELEVESVEPNGVVRLKVTYLAIKEKGQNAGTPRMYEHQYDSTTLDVPSEHPFALTYSAMIGQSFLATVTPHGRVTGLEGVDEMYLRMAEWIAQAEGITARRGSGQNGVEGIRDMLKKYPFLTEAHITEMVADLMVAYPGNPAATDDSWQAKKTLFSQGWIDVDCTYTLKEKTPALMIVGVNSKIDLDNEQVSATGGPLGSARTVLKGSYEGILEIDPTSGWLLRKKATMKCSGQVKMYASAKIPQGRTLYVEMETATTVEPIE